MRIAINGFGRIGRIAYRSMMRGRKDLDLVAVNDVTDAATLAHLLRYDSVHGLLAADVRVEDGEIVVGDVSFRVLSE